MAPGLAQGEEPGEHLREDAGQPGEVERQGEDNGLIDKAKTNERPVDRGSDGPR